MDLAQFAGVDSVDVELAGARYRVGELTLREWAPVQAWIKANVAGPLSSLGSPDFSRLPPAIKHEVFEHALRQDRESWPPRIGSKGWLLALDKEGGHAAVLLAILRKHRPGVTEEECARIVEHPAVPIAEIMPAIVAALGLTGPKSPTPRRGPKGRRGGRAGSTATTSDRGRRRSPRPGDGPATTSST